MEEYPDTGYLREAAEKAERYLKDASLADDNVARISRAVAVIEEAYLRLVSDAERRLKERKKYEEAPMDLAGCAEISFEAGWARLRIRQLLPKRNYNIRTSYFPQNFKRLLKGRIPDGWERGGKKTVVFNHVYSGGCSRKDMRDTDNVETKWIIDSLSGLLFEDDGPAYLSQCSYSSRGDFTGTDVYIVPAELSDTFYEKVESGLRKQELF